MSKNRKELPESYLKMMEALEKNEGVIQRDIHDNAIKRGMDKIRLGPTEPLRPEYIKATAQQQRAFEKKAEQALKEKAASQLDNPKFAKLAAKLGKRSLKAIPIIGTGLGLVDAAKAASEGDYKRAGLETLSAIDPTPLTDVYLAGKDISELSDEQDELERKHQQEQKEAMMSPEHKEMLQKAMQPVTASDMLRIKSKEDYSKPIGRDRFEALTGTKMPKQETEEIAEPDDKFAEAREHNKRIMENRYGKEPPKDDRPRSQRYLKLMQSMYGKE